MRTKAAPGKGRELSPKWRNLSWVLENLGLMDSSAALEQSVSEPKGQKGSTRGYCGLSFPLHVSPKLWLKYQVSSCFDGFPQTPSNT